MSNIKETLINDLRAKLLELDNQINKEELAIVIALKKVVIELLEKVNTIINLKKEGKMIDKTLKLKSEDITKLNKETILNLFPNFNKAHLKQLERYIKVLGTFFFNPNKDEFLNNLSLICNDLLNLINNKESEILTINATINEKKEPIKKLINSIESDYTNIFNNDINYIIEFQKQNGKNEKEILIYIKELIDDIEQVILSSTQKTTQNINEENKLKEDEKEILEENEEDIDVIKQEIIKILKENGYEKLIPYFEEKQSPRVEKIKKELFTYGKINNIEEIIKTFKEYNINLLEEIENGNILKIITLLLYSSKENIEKIFKLALEPEICICKYDEFGNLVLNEKGEPQINFTSLLERASRFISRKRRYKRRGNETQTIELNSEVEGNLGDYIKNIQLFQELGVDIKSLFKKFEQNNKKDRKTSSRGRFLDEPNEKILKNMKVFEFYGIPKESYLSNLDSFCVTEPADAIDMFLELDLFDYLKNNTSRMQIPLTNSHRSYTYYRIIRTYQLANILPNPHNLSLHDIAKQFLTDNYGRLKHYLINENPLLSIGEKDPLDDELKQLDTGIKIINEIIVDEKTGKSKTIKKHNGEEIVKKYTREQVLTEEQLHNFQCFDEVIKAADSVSIDLIDESSLLIRKINAISKKERTEKVLVLGKQPNEFRISKLKFFRIYNALCRHGFNLENDKDCVLYALTYNSILTVEQFEVVKSFVDNALFRGIPKTEGRGGVRK